MTVLNETNYFVSRRSLPRTVPDLIREPGARVGISLACKKERPRIGGRDDTLHLHNNFTEPVLQAS